MILIVRPSSKKQVYGALDNVRLTAIEPPLWAALLAAVARAQGEKVILIDNEVENLSTEDLAFNILMTDPKAVVISVCGHNPSASTQSMIGAEALAAFLTKFKIHTVMHGLHPSALPEDTLKRTKVNAVIVGEGFDVIHKAARLRGIVRSNLTENLDELPRPAWEMLRLDEYRAHNWHCFGHIHNRSPYGIVYSSFGCPKSCSFCVIHAMFNGSRVVRFKAPEIVAKDIMWWVKHVGAHNIRIVDENFTLHKKHVSDICSALRREADKEQFDLEELNIWAYASVDTVNAEMLTNMRSVGIKWLCYGFETGNNAIACSCGKTRSMGDWVDKIFTIASLTRQSGIYTNANWMFGFPDDTWQTMQETLHVAQQLYSEWVNFYCAMAYPGSQLHTEAVEQGWPLPTSWEGFSQYSSKCLPLPTNTLKSHEVLAFRDYAFNTYFSNPGFLAMINGMFGEETMQHIQFMLSNKIKRGPDEL